MYFFDGRIRYSETDSDEKLTLMSLLNYFQDCSTFHSEDIGIRVRYLRERHLVWVLASWQIVVDRYPALCEHVKIGTAPYEFKGFLGSRNFVMMTDAGEYLARANSLWSLLDTESGKPAAVPELMRQRYVLSDRIEMDYAPRRIVAPEGGSPRDPIVVRQHHLDTNHHVNNGQFVNMALDFLPLGAHVGQLRAEYKKQALLNDVLYPYVTENDKKTVVSLNDETGRPYAVIEFTEG